MGGYTLNPFKFNYKSLPEVQSRLEELDVYLPLGENTQILTKSLTIGSTTIPNRMGIAPMEGFDSNEDGTPSELARNRYLKYASGGAGLIWFEAVTIVPEGRSCIRQLALTKENLPAYQRLIDQMRNEGLKKNGYIPYLIMQANHSGRYS